jgi:arabinogalactan endo-1,4-beta-galactosidase
MSVKISWGNEAKTFTLFEFGEFWTWEEYYKARNQGIEMVNTVSHTVNIIVDFTGANMLPNNFLTNMRSSIQTVPRPFDLCVIVRPSPLFMTFINVLNKLKLPVKLVPAKSLDEAYKLMQAHDAKTRSTVG